MKSLIIAQEFKCPGRKRLLTATCQAASDTQHTPLFGSYLLFFTILEELISDIIMSPREALLILNESTESVNKAAGEQNISFCKLPK